VSTQDPDALGARLAEAARTGRPTSPAPFAGLDAETAYDVQDRFVARLDRGPVAGYKLGFTNEAVRREVGVDTPVHGRLLAATVDADVDAGALVTPRAEPEIVVRLGSRLATPDREAAAEAVAGVAPAVEVVDSRTGGWDLGPGTAVADNALAAGLVTGPETAPAASPPLPEVTVRATAGETERRGRGEAAMGDPLAAVAWLAGTRAAPLPAGTLVSTGSLTETLPLRPGVPVTAAFEGLGTVRVEP